MFLNIADSTDSVAAAREDAEKHEQDLIRQLFDRIPLAHYDHDTGRRSEHLDLHALMIWAARRHRSEVLPQLMAIADGRGDENVGCRGFARKLVLDVTRQEYRNSPDEVSEFGLRILDRLHDVGFVSGESASRISKLPCRESEYSACEEFLEILQACGKALYINRKCNDCPPCYPQMLEMLAAVSNGLFQPEAIIQWHDSAMAVPFTHGDPAEYLDYEYATPLQFVSNRRLYRYALNEWWCHPDGTGLFKLVGRAVFDSIGQPSVVRVDGAGDCCIAFGPVETLQAVANELDVVIDTSVDHVTSHDSAPRLEDLVWKSRWDRIRALFANCPTNIPPDELVKLRCNDGETALHLAASHWDGDDYEFFEKKQFEIKMLIDAGAEINAQDSHGNTPLYRAHPDKTVKELLDAGADATLHNRCGQTVLHEAAEDNDVDVLEELISRGIDVDIRTTDPVDPWHPDREYMVHPEIRQRPERLQWSAGQTPLHRAAFSGNDKAIEVLLQHGADPNASDSRQRTALDLAIANLQHDAVAALKTDGYGD